MSCRDPLSTEDLIAYWASDLPAHELERFEEHLMSCGNCTAESARVQRHVAGVRAFVPAFVSRARLERLREEGLSIEENVFVPDELKPVVFRADRDLLVHRLTGLDLSRAERVEITVRAENTGAVLAQESHAPFEEGCVLVACQRHFETLPHDTVFEVRAIEASGHQLNAIYRIPHVFLP